MKVGRIVQDKAEQLLESCKASIMIVDDSTSIRQLLRVTLEREGFEVLEVASGAEALIKLATVRPGLIFLDFIMPLMTGMDFLRIMHSIPELAAIPVVFVTTETKQHLKEEGRRLGCAGWLVKPFKPKQLVEMTEVIFGKREAGELRLHANG